MAQAAKDYNHPEAFCHMRYQSEDGRESEVLWNSRDGVTPFMLLSRSGKHMQHVDWNNDKRDVNYKPKRGDRIFVDATRELVSDIAKARVEASWDHPKYPMHAAFASKEAAAECFIEDWTKPGSPMVVTIMEDGSYKAGE